MTAVMLFGFVAVAVAEKLTIGSSVHQSTCTNPSIEISSNPQSSNQSIDHKSSIHHTSSIHIPPPTFPVMSWKSRNNTGYAISAVFADSNSARKVHEMILCKDAHILYLQSHSKTAKAALQTSEVKTITATKRTELAERRGRKLRRQLEELKKALQNSDRQASIAAKQL